MHYTSWDRSDNLHPRLLVGEDRRELAVFDTKASSATVGDTEWEAHYDKKTGASLRNGTDEYRATGRLGRDDRIEIDAAGTPFAFTSGDGKYWVIEDGKGEKVGQFTAVNHGVREAIVEFVPGNTVTDMQAIALGYFARLSLEQRTMGTGIALISTLVLMTIAAIVSVFI